VVTRGPSTSIFIFEDGTSRRWRFGGVASSCGLSGGVISDWGRFCNSRKNLIMLSKCKGGGHCETEIFRGIGIGIGFD
jgi:hypothetical protein